MSDMDRTQRNRPQSAFKSSGGKWGWIALVVVLIGAGAGYYFWSQQRVPPPAPVVEEPPPPAPAPEPENPNASLKEGDTLLRDWASKFSTAQELIDWLQADDIVRRLVAATQLVANGESPRRMLSFLEVPGTFEVRVVRKKRSTQMFFNPENAQRYDNVAKLIGSVDPKIAAEAYAQLKPFLATAFAEFGDKGSSFDERLGAAIERLARVELPAKAPELEPKGGLWGYVDPKLEALSPAEKHLLRMGNVNAAIVQKQLRAFREAAGLPIVEPPPMPEPDEADPANAEEAPGTGTP